MSQEVISLKLSTGEELIGRLESDDLDAFVLDRPSLIALAPNQDGSIGIRLMPWLAGNQDASVIIYKTHVVAQVSPNKELAKGYLQETSGIQLA